MNSEFPLPFSGGQIASKLDNWKKVTSDPWIIDSVRGVTIPFMEVPAQVGEPRPYVLAEEERNFIDQELVGLLDKGVLEICTPTSNQVVSNIFLRPKKDGSFRLILDLTWVNEHVEYAHFKMCSLNTALEMMRPDCWMGSIDLKDAYYSVLVREEHRVYLRFKWRDILYQFRVLPNGLACAPRFFTKLLNPVFATIREGGGECFPYIDDSFVVADTKEECVKTLGILQRDLKKLGFVIHPTKSVLEPVRELVFLGFLLDSRACRVFLTKEKEEKLTRAATDLLAKNKSTIREVAGLIGLLVAYSPAFRYADLHTKLLEREKIDALRAAKGNFNGKMKLSWEARCEIFWWIENITRSGRAIRESDPETVLFTDASSDGWGAHVGTSATGGRWSEEEKLMHINVLELRAILFGLKSLCEGSNRHIRVMSDNTIAVAYVKHQGGVKSPECDGQAKLIWNWCEERNIWLSIAHIPGVENTLADAKLRKFADNLEWKLGDKIFQKVVENFGVPDIDMFASRLNKKTEVFVSWGPDPEAAAVDAFTLHWSQFKLMYAFPPFSLVGRTVAKILEDGARAILVVPWWPTKPWWGRIAHLGLRQLKFRPRKGNLVPTGLPDSAEMLGRLPLGVFLFLGND